MPDAPNMTPNQQPISRPHESPWSWRLMTVMGIPIRLHVTFLLLLIWLAVAALRTHSQAPAFGLLYVLGIFACVVLHELGHSVVAVRFGIRVRDIVLYPIGGIASIEKLPKPAQELWIALAGPAVNVVIAILLAIVLSMTVGLRSLMLVMEPGHYWQKLLVANVSLAVFNMVPAFPMDGGRVLRALLGLSMPEVVATAIAGRIGQFLAFVFGLFGALTGIWTLLFIALFVYIGASYEMTVYQNRAMLEGVSTKDAMLSDFRTLTPQAKLQEAIDLLLATSQRDFPVLIGDQPVGILTRTALIRGLSKDGPSGYVSGHMEREYIWATADEPLESVLSRMQSAQMETALVMNDNRLIGLVTIENVTELLTVRSLSRASFAA